MTAMDALVTSGASRIAYSALRSLCSLGLSVAVADTYGVGISQWSRFCRGKYLYRNPLTQPEGFIEDINGILKNTGARYLMPALIETEVLSRYRDRLPEGVMLPVAAPDKIHMANDKSMMAAFAKEIGVNVAEVIEWDSLDELGDKLAALGGPVVVKLRWGHGALGVYYPSDIDEALSICKGLIQKLSLGPGSLPMVQRRVTGEGWGVSCLYHRSRKLASFTHRRLREKIATGGASTLRVSARNATLEAWADRLLGGMEWHGLAMVEFKYNPESKDAWFIEINPRLWGSIHLAEVSGVDFVKLLYVASNEGPDKALGMVRPQRDGVVCRWWMGDAIRARTEARHLRLIKALKLLMPGGTDYYDDFRKDDPGAAVGYLFRSMLGRVHPDKMTRDPGCRDVLPVS